jgi:RimJ/RimL family protein N-acetyltransferase
MIQHAGVDSVRLETRRLVIRTFEPQDAEPWIAMVNDPDVLRFLPPGPAPTMEMFQTSMDRRHAMEREHGYAMWAVDAKETGVFIGQCGFFPAERKGPEIELAYHFNKASWNRGYATEAAIGALGYVFGPVALDRVIAVVMPGNVGSCRVVEKAGMRFDGIATYYDIPGLRKYVADRDWWRAKLRPSPNT